MKSGFPIVASAMGPMLRRLSHTCRTRGEVEGRKKVRMGAHPRISTELVGPFPQFAWYSYTTPSFQSHILRGFAIAIVKFASMLFLHHVLAKTVKFATLAQTIKLADSESDRTCILTQTWKQKWKERGFIKTFTAAVSLQFQVSNTECKHHTHVLFILPVPQTCKKWALVQW